MDIMQMPIESVWDDPQRNILRTSYYGIWTWSELHEHDDGVVIPMIGASQQPVSLIIDMTEAFWFMPGSILNNIKRWIARHSEFDIDYVVFVSESDGIRALLETAHRRFGTPGRTYVAVTSLDESREFIEDKRSVF